MIRFLLIGMAVKITHFAQIIREIKIHVCQTANVNLYKVTKFFP